MNGLLVLGQPMCQTVANNYKGLYREQPFPNSVASPEMIALWECYVQHCEERGRVGITDELSLDELLRLAKLSQECMHTPFEVIYFNREHLCPYPGAYYGIDVTGNGGYSILGEGGFSCSGQCRSESLRKALQTGNMSLAPMLNQYGLFRTEAEADGFVLFLNHLSAEYPGCIEDEHWTKVHIWKITMELDKTTAEAIVNNTN